MILIMNDDELRDKISLDELYTRTKDVEDLRLRVYKKILNRAHQKIKFTSRQRDTGHFCFFIVPEFLVGTPRYDSAACIAYVMDKLTQNGFMVKYTHPNLLFISWQHYIPKYQRQNFKKKYGYSIDGFGNQVQDKKKDTKNVDAAGEEQQMCTTNHHIQRDASCLSTPADALSRVTTLYGANNTFAWEVCM